MSTKRLLLTAALILAILVTASNLEWVEAKPLPTRARYIFLFIGDGMGVAQRNSAELYLASIRAVDRPEKTRLIMNTFPAQGMNTTYDVSSLTLPQQPPPFQQVIRQHQR